MNLHRLAAAGLAVVAMVAITGGVAVAQQPSPTPTPTPGLPIPSLPVPGPGPGPSPEDTIAEICAATGIEMVDEALQGVATTELVQSLRPLVSLVIPEGADSVVLKTDIELDDVRTALECEDPVTPTPAPSATPEPDEDPPYESCAEARADGVDTPIRRASSNYSTQLDSDGDGLACELNEGDDDDGGVDRAPIGGVDTGYGPA